MPPCWRALRGGLVVVVAISGSLPCNCAKPDADCDDTLCEGLGGKSQRSLLQAVVITGRQDASHAENSSGTLNGSDVQLLIVGSEAGTTLAEPLRDEIASHVGEVLVEERSSAVASHEEQVVTIDTQLHAADEVRVEERADHQAAADVGAHHSKDDPIPVVYHSRVDGDSVTAYDSMWLWMLTDDVSLLVMLFLFLLLLLLCACSFCCLKYQHPDTERLTLKSNPRLIHQGVEVHSTRPLHVHYKEGAERIFTVRGLQAAALDSWYKTENSIVDVAGRLVLKAFVTVPQRVDWYQQWYWHWQREGLVDVWRATPFGRMMGVGVKEHPTIALHSPAPADQDPRFPGPVFACCRAAPPAQGGQMPESTCQYFYDADDHLFASMARVGYLGTYKYVVSAAGTRLTFSGSFSAHDILVTDARGDQVAVVQQATKEQDPSRQCYNVRILPAVEWSTVIVVLTALQAIEVEELVTSTNQAAAAAASAAAAVPAAGSQPTLATSSMPPSQPNKPLTALSSMSAMPS